MNDGPAPKTLQENDFDEFYEGGFAEQIPVDQVELPIHMQRQALFWPEALQYETDEEVDQKWFYLNSIKAFAVADEYLEQEFDLSRALLTCRVPDFGYDDDSGEVQFKHNIGRGGRKTSVKFKTLTFEYDPQTTTFEQALDLFVAEDPYFKQAFPYFDVAERPFPKNYRYAVNENGNLLN